MDNLPNILFNGNIPLNNIFLTEKFNEDYINYTEKSNISDLILFLDNIETNKKYYQMSIQKNKKYKKKVTEDTQSIKKINSMVNKLTELNFESLKPKILQEINKDFLVPYIIENIFEKSILHHNYIELYVEILNDMNKTIESTQKELRKLFYKYYNILFSDKKLVDINQNEYQKLCDKNKKTDNIIGFSLLVTHLEKKKIMKGYINEVLEPFLNNLNLLDDDIKLYQMLLSFENISKIYFKNIPYKYLNILQDLKESSDSSKIRFKIMDILGE